jgi:DNA-binding GntR family transcriptional regulator
VPIEALKAEFGVNKQPIMEALRRLETIGLVEIEPRSGCRVRTYAPQETCDFFTVFASPLTSHHT